MPRQRDTLKTYTLPAVTVSVTRANLPMSTVPLSVQLVEKTEISRARPTWGLDEALATVPGVYAANRYNFSLDQRISIRGFGARSAFAVRGIKVLLDGIPQTLPDGQGQLTNLELGDADRIEVLRGSSSALFGNASGGVISIWTDAASPNGVVEELRVQGGTFDRHLDRTWTKWQSSTRFRVADGSALVTVSRLDYTGERQHSDADLRNLNVRLHQPLSPVWSLSVLADAGDQPRADNPGALTAAEMAANPDSAAAINITRRAGKDVTQFQGGATLRRQFPAGGEATLTVFGLARDLKNPTTFAYIDLDRVAYGARLTVTRRLTLGSRAQRLTAGLDFQRQRDDRLNFGNNAGQPDNVRLLDQLEHVTELGPFVQSALDLTPRVTVTGGVRYDWVDFRVADRLVSGTNPDDSGRRLMRSPSGSLGVTVAASDAVTVYANVGTSFETPTTTELTNRPTMAGGFNPSLEPQKATNYEVGARGDAAGRLNYSVALYQVNVRDALIPFQVQDPSSSGRVFFQNAGRTRHRGLELGAHLAVVPGVSLITSWTVSHFRYTDFTVGTRRLDGRELPGIPKHWLNLLLQARPGFARGAWAEVAETHSSGYFTSDTLDVRTAPWWTTSVRLGWDGEIGSVRVRPFVGFNNVFNRGYVSSVVLNATGGRYYEPAPGRNMYLGCSVGAGR
jgi:iron complex outermembrane recepter protein